MPAGAGRQLGLAVPRAADVGAEIDRGLDRFYLWVEGVCESDEFARPEASDPRAMAAARLINRSLPAAYFGDPAIMSWLVLEGWRLWVADGPSPPLVCVLSYACFLTLALRQDFRTAYTAGRHVLAVAEARGYEPESSQARFLFSATWQPWFEELEGVVAQLQRAYEGLVQGGDLLHAGFARLSRIVWLFDCAPTLEAGVADADAGFAFAARTATIWLPRPSSPTGT
jgi:hypothetical protein